MPVKELPVKDQSSEARGALENSSTMFQLGVGDSDDAAEGKSLSSPNEGVNADKFLSRSTSSKEDAQLFHFSE
jgi:hypothetical protein